MRRYFRAVRLRVGSCASLGITETTNGGKTTVSIASLYYGEGQSNKQAFDTIMQYVTNQLEPGENAKVFFSNVKFRSSYVEPYAGRCRVVSKRSNAYGMQEAEALAADALKRKDSIIEQLETKEGRLQSEDTHGNL
jgi:hypothetical protein